MDVGRTDSWRLPLVAMRILMAWTAFGAGGAATLATPVTPAGILPCDRVWTDEPTAAVRALTADCVTEAPIRIPAGWDFDGLGHRIRVNDPTGGLFRGGALEVHGGTTNVREVAIDGSGLTPGCRHDAVVAGVLFVDAMGTVAAVTVTDMRRGAGDRCGYGVIIGGTASGAVRVSDTTIHGAGDAGVVVTGGRGEVSGVIIEGAGRDGIIVCCAGTTGTIVATSIVRPGYAGVSVEDGAEATIQDSLIQDPGAIGIIAISGASVEVTDGNELRGGAAGVVASDPGTKAVVDGNTFEGQTRDGIYVQNGAAATVSDNTLTLAGGNGITFSATTGAGMISGNSVFHAASVGIAVRDGAVVEHFSDNVIRGGESGIRVTGQHTAARIDGNAIDAATDTGIAVADNATAEATDNVIIGPGTASTAAAFGPAGIHYAHGASGAVRGNHVSNYLSDYPNSLACGIAIDGDANDVELGENAFPAPGNASNVCRDAPPEFWIPGRASVIGTPVPSAG